MIMVSNYRQERRRIALARAQATLVPVFIRVTATNPRPNANAEIARWASHNPIFQKWPAAVNPKLVRKWRMVNARYFRQLARLVSDGPAVSVVMGTSPASLAPADIEIPFGSRPVIVIKVVSA
jgi:hypothetical protein